MKAEYMMAQPIEPMSLGVDTTAFDVYVADKRYVVAPRGTAIEGPNVWQLVRVGSAKPADKECRDAAGMTDEQIVAKYNDYQKLSRGQLTGNPKYDAPNRS